MHLFLACPAGITADELKVAAQRNKNSSAESNKIVGQKNAQHNSETHTGERAEVHSGELAWKIENLCEALHYYLRPRGEGDKFALSSRILIDATMKRCVLSFFVVCFGLCGVHGLCGGLQGDT